jgi:Novel toxin 10
MPQVALQATGNDPVNAVDEDGGAPEIWGKKQNERGNFEYQWFNGNTVPEGWTSVGNFAADIHCTNGRYATLHDGGRVTWSDHSSQVIQTRYAVADPALFKTPAAPIPRSHYFFDPAPAEGQPVALSSPASQYFFDMRVNRNSWNSQGLFTAITPASMVQRHFAHHPDDIGGGWMYSAVQSAHNFNTAVKEGNWVDAIANGGNFVVALAPPLAYSGMGRGNAGMGLTNPIPNRLARVIPANINSSTLGAPGAADVFVTAAEDIRGLNANQIARRLSIPNSISGFRVIEFNTPRSGLASPINRTNPGFVGFGRTAGGAREFVLPNQSIPNGSKIRIVL